MTAQGTAVLSWYEKVKLVLSGIKANKDTACESIRERQRRLRRVRWIHRVIQDNSTVQHGGFRLTIVHTRGSAPLTQSDRFCLEIVGRCNSELRPVAESGWQIQSVWNA